MPQRCHICGRTEKEHKKLGVMCFGSMGSWVGQNMKGGEKPSRKVKEPKK
jgi:hypothetical protein